MYAPGRPLGYFYFYFYWLFSFFSDFYKFIKMVFDVFPFGVIYLYLMEFPMHIWILLQIVVILILHTCHFDKVVWTHPHPLSPSRCNKASVQKTGSRSGFSSKIQFIWYITLDIWVTSNFSLPAFEKYLAFCDLIRTCTNMGFLDLESPQSGASCDTHIT